MFVFTCCFDFFGSTEIRRHTKRLVVLEAEELISNVIKLFI